MDRVPRRAATRGASHVSGPGDERDVPAAATAGTAIALSAVVPVYNGAATLARCLAAAGRVRARRRDRRGHRRRRRLDRRLGAHRGRRRRAGAVLGRAPRARRRAQPGRGGRARRRRCGSSTRTSSCTTTRRACSPTRSRGPARRRCSAPTTRRPADPGFLSQYKNLAHRHQHCSADAGGRDVLGRLRRRACAAPSPTRAASTPALSASVDRGRRTGLRLRARGFTICIEPRAARRRTSSAGTLADLLRTDVLRSRAAVDRLIARATDAAPMLNTRPGELARAALAWALALSLPCGGDGPRAALDAGRALRGGDRGASRACSRCSCARAASPSRSARSLFHQVHYLYASAAFVAARLGWTASRSVPSSTSSKA